MLDKWFLSIDETPEVINLQTVRTRLEFFLPTLYTFAPFNHKDATTFNFKTINIMENRPQNSHVDENIKGNPSDVHSKTFFLKKKKKIFFFST